MRGSWRLIGSIISILLFIGFGVLRSSLANTFHNELAANIVGIGMWLAFAYTGFDMLTSPETSVLYLINRRPMVEFASIGGMLAVLVGLFGAAVYLILIVRSFTGG